MKIAIISPDTIELPAVNISSLSEEIKNKCLRQTGVGVRALNITKQLSKKFETTLFIPDINFNSAISLEETEYKIDTYNYALTSLSYHKELQEKLEEFDIVIVQSNSGSCFLNCIALSYKIKLVVDAWIPSHIEIFGAIEQYSQEYQEMYWNLFTNQYNDLLKRADILLYNIEPHYYYYVCSVFNNKKFNWIRNDCKNLIKLTFGIDKYAKIQKNVDKDVLKLIFHGPLYPWHDYSVLIDVVSRNKNIQLDFIAVKHPRYHRIYDNMYNKVFKELKCDNINFVESYSDNRAEIFKNYDAQILFTKDSYMEKFIFACRVMDSLSFGLPVFLNKENPIFNVMSNIKDSIYPIQKENLTCTLNYYAKYKDELKVSDESFSFIQNNYSWEEACKDLINYLDGLDVRK